MTKKILKYNPSFLSDQELIESFVVRQVSLERILDVVRDNTHKTNQHVLVLGPRGSGKTTLLRRVAAEIRQTPELASDWFPLPFGEESYEVSSAGELWLEAIHHLGVNTGDPTWAKIYNELLQELDEKRLQQRSLAYLLDFADSNNKKLLLLIENLNLILGEQLEDSDAWALRDTLMHEPRLMLLGSATNSFDAIVKPNQPMYELFRLIELSRLTIDECIKIWSRVAGHNISPDQARAVQILTGGNPRLMTILAVFGGSRSFRVLLEDLSLLVDEHTDYFKSNFESLPPAERKVFACLATLWEDSLTSDVARAARMSTNKASSLLKRLESRGVVQSVARKGGKKRYQLTERLYNIYYLMRRGQEGGRVRAVVQFMLQYYGQERLHEAIALVAKEACSLKEGQRQEHYRAIQMIWSCPEAREKLDIIREDLPKEFMHLSDIPESIKPIFSAGNDNFPSSSSVFRNTYNKAVEEGRWEECESLLREALDGNPDDARAWAVLGSLLSFQLGQHDEGASSLRKSLELAPEDASAWASLGSVLAFRGGQPVEGASALRKSLEIEPEKSEAWAALGSVLAYQLGELEEGEKCLRKSVELFPENAQAWGSLGYLLVFLLDQPEEGASCLRKAVECDPKEVRAWAALGGALAYKLGQPEEGAGYLRKASELDPEDSSIWQDLGTVLAFYLDKAEEGASCLRKASELDPGNAEVWGDLGIVLAFQVGLPEEGATSLRKATELDPGNAEVWTYLGSVLAFDLAQPEEGMISLLKALELDPKNIDALTGLGGVLAFELNRPEEGVKYLHKAVELDPSDTGALVNLGSVLANMLDQPEEGVSILRNALKDNPNDAEIHAILGSALVYSHDQPEDGLSHLRKSVELDPENMKSWSTLGGVLVDEFKQYEEGVDVFRRAVSLDPKNADCWAYLGKILANDLEDPKEGVRCLRIALELDPKKAWPWATLGRALAHKLAQPEEGASCLRNAVELDPDDSWSWAVLGSILAFDLDQPEEGLSCLHQAVECDPDDYWAWNTLGVIQAFELFQPEEGASSLLKSLEVKPDYAQALVHLGVIYTIDPERQDEAIDCFRRAAEIDILRLDNPYLLNAIEQGGVSISFLEKMLKHTGCTSSLVNNVVAALVKGGNYNNLLVLEKWMRQAIAQKDIVPHAYGTLAMILALRGLISESLEYASLVFKYPNVVSSDIQEATDIMALAAAYGHGEKALELIMSSPSSEVLEPIVVGLNLYLGFDVQAPQEVREIGCDIVKRIEHWKKGHVGTELE